jgi:TrmH family RNA methyltransferase
MSSEEVVYMTIENRTGPERTCHAEAVRFVLVEPRYPGNVGAAARAMKNLGFRRLTLVDPHCHPLDLDARKMAVGALDVLEEAEVRDSLDQALQEARTVVGTSRRVGKHRKPHYRLDEIAREMAAFSRAGELAVVFGRETHGLSDAELDRCTHLVYLPSSGDFPSFNLAQSVLLVAYQLGLSVLGKPDVPPLEPPAHHSEREEMYLHLQEALWTVGFLHEDSAEVMMRRLRRMLGRAMLTSDEVKILRGVARQTLWAARQAGLKPPVKE